MHINLDISDVTSLIDNLFNRQNKASVNGCLIRLIRIIRRQKMLLQHLGKFVGEVVAG